MCLGRALQHVNALGVLSPPLIKMTLQPAHAVPRVTDTI